MLQILLIAFLVLPLSGCLTKPAATGRDYEVVAMVPGNLWIEMKDDIRGILERPIFGVHTEKAFRVIQTLPQHPEPYHTWRKILVVGTIEDTPVVRELLDEQELTNVEPDKIYLKPMNNVWASGQFVLLLYTEKSESLRGALTTASESVFDLINDAFLEEEWYRMYTSGENTETHDYFLENYGFSLEMPKIYRLADEDTLEVSLEDGSTVEMNAVRLFNLNPHRSFVVCWKEGVMNELDGERIRLLRQAIGRMYYPGDELLTERVETTRATFNEHDAIKLRGVWENRERLQGGLFLSYAFNCPENDRFYLIDGILFHPDPERSKYPYLVQMSIILHSFGCSADTSSDRSSEDRFRISMEDLF